MEAAEPDIDHELEELELRLERLRALYEQYFLGIEKIEPNIARKDVDRRIWTLRRMKFRNTAKRFKLQTIVMRYNTFQQYWQRICREIENGTYRRHLLKAERRLGEPLTIAARKRMGMFAKGEEAAAERARSQDAKSSTEKEMAALLDAPASALDDAMKALDDVFAGNEEPTQERTVVDSAPPPASTRDPKRQAAKKLNRLSLDLDLDGLGGDRAKPKKPTRSPTAAAKFPQAAEPKPKPATPPAARPATKPGPPPGGMNRPPAPGRPRPPLRPPAAIRAEPGTEPGVGGPRPAPPPPGKRPATKPGIPPPGRRPARPPARPGAPPLPRPPPPHRARPPAGKPGPARASTVTDEKVRDLHARLVDAKRQTRDAKGVSVDGLAKSLRATERQLRQKHGNRDIDFDVVIKDGKAVLKPTIK